ncbi:MAG: methyl-accepting chemotaxis protein [Geothrix sp.]|uniref:methyl-accepting chemotaxis protein n=1 Tax=Geothrix sp. TaxID=1962974 RepID=UPI0017B24582|nr:methyl-accepting chemotaxis protein [Geothrix sp.]NWJ40315.1 methyl-accepting chemotaxis protein [Geothrix sp.]WIL21680.1 MAG: methyl-accepting chemotaxis protein [Geothrix sp.]
MGLPFLGLVAYLLFRHASALVPAEGAILIMATAGLVRAGLRWWDWQRGLASDGSLMDWVQRILGGERQPMAVPEGLREPDERMAEALNAVLEDVQAGQGELRELRKALRRDWSELDAALASIQQLHAAEAEHRSQGAARLATLGRELKTAIEDTLRLDQIELNYRLRADQFRLQGQAFRSTLDQLREGLDHFENLLEELQDTFPRLRREEDALGRLADAGLRQGARLSLSVKGLVAHTPRLVDETQARTEGLRRLRHSADGVRDQTEALARRIESFREEAQARIRSFGGAQGTLKELDHVAQQTGLLAVNAAILAQQEGGSAGMAAIGGRLRFLADQTADGASGMERTLSEYQRGLERETSNLWDLQEVTQKLMADVHELLRTVGNMDHQGHDLERALETHMGLVDQVRQSSERAELSLHEVGARSMAMEAAHVRQWGVEAKITPQRERLSRMGLRLTEVGGELARISQQNIDEIWDILARHQEIRRTGAYRQVTSGELPQLVEVPESAEASWNGIAWARAERRLRLLERDTALSPPIGRRDPEGGLRLQLLGQDALHRPEPSALEAWGCDATGHAWDLHLLGSLRTESHRLALLALLKESPLVLCFPGVDIHIASEGARIRLPHPYPGLPAFLAGLRLELPVAPELLDHPFREDERKPREIQGLIWIGPGQGGGVQNACMRLVHAWVRDDHRHESFLPWLPYEGHRQPCPWLGDSGVEEPLLGALPVRCLDLDADPSLLLPIRDQLAAAGAVEATGGATLCVVSIGHPHPEALLLRLFQPDADLAGAFHPDLVPYQVRLREEVLGGATGDPYRAAWSLLEDLQRKGWLMPLPLL